MALAPDASLLPMRATRPDRTASFGSDIFTSFSGYLDHLFSQVLFFIFKEFHISFTGHRVARMTQ